MVNNKKISNLIQKFVDNIRTNNKLIIILFIGIFIVHSPILYFGFTHVDSISCYNLESGYILHNVSIGRYIYAIILSIGNIFKFNYLIPYFDSVLALVLLAFASFICIDILNIKDKVNRLLLMFIISSSAAIGEMAWCDAMFFGSMLSLFLASFAIYLIKDIDLVNLKDNILLIILSVVCLFISLGIYQAYIVVTVTLMIILIIIYSLNNNNFKKLFFKALIYFFVVFISIVVYLLGFYIFAKIMNVNVSNRTHISISSILRNLIKSYGSIYYFMFKEYARTTNLLPMNLAYIYVFISMIYMGINLLLKYKFQKLLFIIFCILFPIAINLPRFMTGNNGNLIRINMGFLFPFVLFVVLYEYYINKNKEKHLIFLNKCIVSIVLIIVLLCQFNLRQGDYQNYINYTNATRSQAIMLVERIQLVKGYSPDKKICFIGRFVNKSNYYEYYSFMEDFWGFIPSLNRLAGFKFNECEGIKKEELTKNEEVKNMLVYPSDGSIKLVDDVIVVKLENIK